MKILYVIFNIDYGKGGHFHSLSETATQLSKHEDVIIVSIGIEPSPVLAMHHERYIHIPLAGFISTISELYTLVKKENPDVINSFDTQSFFFCRIVSYLTKKALVLTLCGGPNPTKYYPFHDDVVLYSKENETYFLTKSKFRKTNFTLIPNRVDIDRERQDLTRINGLKERLGKKTITILRIARISTAYKRSILQSIELTKQLVNHGFNVQLVIIGIVQDKDIYNELIVHESESIFFIVDDRFTLNASELIDLADIVVGTGRGFMEAALLNKLMLVPACNTNIPVLISKSNIEQAFEYNFSPRYSSLLTSEQALDEIVYHLKSGGNVDLYDFYKYNFSATKIYEKYLPVYEKAQVAKLNLLDTALNFLLVVRYTSKRIMRYFNRFFLRK